MSLSLWQALAVIVISGGDSRILSRRCGAQAFGDYCVRLPDLLCRDHENELFFSGLSLPAVSCTVLLKQLFAQYLEEMNGQYIWSARWHGLIERVQLPKPTRPSLSHLHYTLRSPASTRASART